MFLLDISDELGERVIAIVLGHDSLMVDTDLLFLHPIEEGIQKRFAETAHEHEFSRRSAIRIPRAILCSIETGKTGQIPDGLVEIGCSDRFSFYSK